MKYVQIGNAGVDSGMLMVVDPAYVLDESPEAAKFAKENGVVKASDSFNTNYDVAMDVCYEGSDRFRIVTEKDKDGKTVAVTENGKTVIERIKIFNPLDEMTPEQHRQIAYGESAPQVVVMVRILCMQCMKVATWLGWKCGSTISW